METYKCFSIFCYIQERDLTFKTIKLSALTYILLFGKDRNKSNGNMEILNTGLTYISQEQLQEWTEHSHTDLLKSETSRDIKKSFEHHLNIFKNYIDFQNRRVWLKN